MPANDAHACNQKTQLFDMKCADNAKFGISTVTLIVGDLVVLNCMLVLAMGLRLWSRSWLPIEVSLEMFMGVVVASLFLPLGYAAAQLYPGYGQTPVERLRKRVTVTAFGFGAMILFDYLAQHGQWSRGILLAAAALSMVAISVWDGLAIKFLCRRGLWGEGVIVIGDRERRRSVTATLNAHPELGWIPAAETNVEMANLKPVPAINVALVALPLESIGSSLATDDLPYRRVVLVPDVDSLQTQWVTACAVGPYLGLQIQQNLLIRRNQAVKRSIDLVAGIVLLIAACPVMAVCAALVFLTSPGPVFYRQIRIGRDGTPFRMWKLRTMVPDAEARLASVIANSSEANANWQKSMKIIDDPRIVPWVGRLLRRFSLDELPQFWNVIRGEMSLVGPRPLPAYHTERFAPLANRLRQRVRPGITGLWQVSGRSDSGVAHQQHLDIYYVRNWSLWLDIHILARTIMAVLGGKGAW